MLGTDEMIAALSQLCSYALPVAGVIFLVYLILVLRDTRVLIKDTAELFKELAELGDNCNSQINKFDKTITNVSDLTNMATGLVSMDSINAVKNVVGFLSKKKK